MFRERGIGVVVIDDLSSGHRDFVPEDVPFVEANILDGAVLARTLREHEIVGVVHLAGFKYAGESVPRPLHTYEQNVEGTRVLLPAMQDAQVGLCVFSSSAAVYGIPDVDLVTEATPLLPASPYGESKLIAEWLIRDQAVAAGLAHTSLRYFNVVGSGYPDLYDSSPHNLFPLAISAILEGRAPRINGDDYPTPDGTCVRDYVHVQDLAFSHVIAAEKLMAGVPLQPAYNLGSGQGQSVREVLDALLSVMGAEFSPRIGARRPGDPPRIVANQDLAAADLQWEMRHSVEEMARSAWYAAKPLRALGRGH